MKKLFTLLLTICILFTFGQQVDREEVLLEIGTGTWCPYCPGAAMGADDLIANGHDVAVIEYHSGDGFTNPEGEARISYYGITGFPTAFFDGVLSYVGGSSSSSMYSNYLPLYNQRIVIPCDFEMEIYGENTTGNNYSVSIMVDMVNTNTSNNLVVHLALTESEIVYSWQGQSELNFVERLMAPDADGTSLSFAGGNEQQIDLTFTINPSWNTAHCEVVAFVQDAVTKEVMQGIKVGLDDMQPFVATAIFSCSDTEPCINTPVDFTDASLGAVTNWYWTFEGGDPATSTLQNPTVTYNATGIFDVELVVYDGAVYDTLLMDDYIEAITNPVQPDMPSGPENPCENSQGLTYTIPSVYSAATYTWEVLPAAAGTITGDSTTGTLDLATGFTGAFTVKVRADNDCGNGTFSPELSCTARDVPEEFTLSNGAGYCEGGQGVEVTLDGSEVGVNYELFVDDVTTGQILPGTGTSLNFGYQTTQGIYTCIGSTDYCLTDMIGNTYIYVINIPGQAGIPIGPESICNNVDTTSYVTSGASDATAYNWVLEPEEAGQIDGIDEIAMVTWDPDFDGTAMIKVQGVNTCGDGVFSEETEVTVHEESVPSVSGESLVCDNQGGYIYSTPENAGSFYSWEVTGGEVTSGAGTSEIQVSWGEPGTGTVTVTEENEFGCAEASEGFEVTIDDCTGLIESGLSGIKLYPNPVNDRLTVLIPEADAGDLHIQIFDHVGKVLLDEVHTIFSGEQKVQLHVAGFTNGFYFIRISKDDGTFTESRFTKVN
jgi:PKD repeat protein